VMARRVVAVSQAAAVFLAAVAVAEALAADRAVDCYLNH
jgi:hypothetical protein